MNSYKKILSYKTLILLILIIALAGFVRVYNISNAPPALNWDEAAVGYNAWTIANYGRDETGKLFPLSFRSFLEEKHPVHVYFTALFVKIFGLSEFSTRVPAALFGVLSIIIIFLTVRLIFKNDYIALITAFVLAISPYAIHFSRFNHELNFALFFTFLGIYSFIKGLEKKNVLLTFSFLFFSIGFITYLSAKILIPLILLALCLLYFNKLRKLKKFLTLGLIWLVLFGILIFLNPSLLGGARIKQVSFPDEEIKNTFIYTKTNSEFLGKANLITSNYLSHFGVDYLFNNGDKNPRLSSQVSGEFFKIDAIFLILGLIGLLKFKNKGSLIILLLALFAPLPASFSSEVPHAGRAMFVVGSWHIIIAVGIYIFLSLFKSRNLIVIFFVLISLVYIASFRDYIFKYHLEYNKRYAVDWQYGMKDIVRYIRQNPQYSYVYMTSVRAQPYIFFLFYTQMPLDEYLADVEYNNIPERKSSNLVASFDHYQFEYWDPIEIKPIEGNLYVLTPDQYDGLRYKSDFKIKKIVYYPNRTTAFYLVSKN